MDDPNSKSLRERQDALLRRAREISAEIERRVEEVTSDPAEGHEVEGEGHSAGTASPGAASGEGVRGLSPANSTIATETAGGTPPDESES